MLTRGSSPRRSIGRRAGFTLIDVLVALVVIAILVALMFPAIGAVRETARRVHCGSNLRQLGVGIQLYANGNRDRVPASAVQGRNMAIRGQQIDSLTSVVRLRYAEDSVIAAGEWTGLGRLFGLRILEAPGVAYCPSHEGDFTLEAYKDEWGLGEGELCGNFYLRDRTAPRRLSDAPSRTALAIDGFPNHAAFNHADGANVLRADISVGWKSDPTGDLAESLSPQGHAAAQGDGTSSDGNGGPGTSASDPWKTLDFFSRAKPN